MKSIFLATLPIALFCLASPAFAGGHLTVKKVKGQNALVEFPSSMVPEKDGDYTISDGHSESSDDEPQMGDGSKKINYPRDFAWSLGVSFTSLKTKVSTAATSSSATASAAVTTITVSTTFLFNFGIIEVGPLVSLTSTSSGGVASTTFRLGPDIDINFISNKSTHNFIPGLEIDGGLLSSSTAGVSSTGYFLDAGLYAKMFPFKNQTAIKLFAGFTITSTAINSVTTSISGPSVQFSLMSYF